MSGQLAPPAQLRKSAARPVSHRQDPDEREAERAADVVARGGSVASWSFSNVAASASAPVRRQEVLVEKTEEEEKKEALEKTKEAALETPQAKALKEKVLADPLVNTVKDAVTSTPGLIVSGAALAGGVGALAATGKELPIQPPEIPLDKITPGLSGKVTYQGPVNAPTFVGISITFKEQGPKKKAGPSQIATDIARIKAQEQMFKPEGQKSAEKQQEQEMISAWIASQSGLTIPLKGAPKAEEAPKKEEEEKKTPVQPAPASASVEPAAETHFADVLTTPARPLDASTRRTMEARFGYDFSGVRVHDDTRAAATAAEIDAAAFTVGRDVVFGSGRFAPSTSEGGRLLAHELAHVVQQAGGARGLGRRAPVAPPRQLELEDARSRGDHDRVTELIREGQGPGVALPVPLGRALGSHFRRDLGEIRVHTDTFADATAARLHANAFTVGNDVFFRSGMYAPDRPDGWRRLTHEVAHTLQQRGSAAPHDVDERRLEAEADRAALSGAREPLSSLQPTVLCEPTYPRRTTGDRMIREAEQILTTTRDPDATNATTRLWSRVQSNFAGSITTGTIARRIWTFIFLRHFTEPESRPGVESEHPRYLYSHTYGWIDAQHFFGFVDFAEQQLAAQPADREAAFRAATQQGIEIEAGQQQVRDYVVLGAPAATGPARLMQVRPPNTPLFRAPQMAAGSAANAAATAYLRLFGLSGTQRELFALLNEEQRQKFFLDSAKSAWSYEDIVSNQLGIRFFFTHGPRINALSPAAREPAFIAALAAFFTGIRVENDQGRLDELARPLPQKERYLRPTTTEERDRQRHPELFAPPTP